MKGLKIIITGATGMVGEGVLFECLQNASVEEVLMVNRRHYEYTHEKLRELIVPDFTELEKFANSIQGYDACFFCAGISSVGMKEEEYTYITYTVTLAFAKVLLQCNSNMVFNYISGSHTDSTEKSRLMWARVKGRTEKALLLLGFKAVYNFRPGLMLPFKHQKNWKVFYKIVTRLVKLFAPKNIITMHELGKAMINCVITGYKKNVLEISDIKLLAAI